MNVLADRNKISEYKDLLTSHSKGQVNNGFLISIRNKYLFHPIGKVANSSIKGLLMEAELISLGIPYEKEDLTTENVHKFYFGPLLRPFQLRNQQFVRMLSSDEFYKFVFVRNPISRLVSCYLDRIQSTSSVPYKTVAAALGYRNQEKIGIEEFVEFVSHQKVRDMNPHWRPQYYDAFADRIHYDKICKMENFVEDMSDVIGDIYRHKEVNLDFKRNLSPAKTNANSIAEGIVNPKLRRTIESIYEVDFEAFDY